MAKKIYLIDILPGHLYRTSGPGGEIEVGVVSSFGDADKVYWSPGASGRVFTSDEQAQAALESMTDDEGVPLWRTVALPEDVGDFDLDAALNS